MTWEPPKYTEDELRDALIADLEADLRFVLENNPEWVAYIETLEKKLERLRRGGR